MKLKFVIYVQNSLDKSSKRLGSLDTQCLLCRPPLTSQWLAWVLAVAKKKLKFHVLHR